MTDSYQPCVLFMMSPPNGCCHASCRAVIIDGHNDRMFGDNCQNHNCVTRASVGGTRLWDRRLCTRSREPYSAPFPVDILHNVDSVWTCPTRPRIEPGLSDSRQDVAEKTNHPHHVTDVTWSRRRSDRDRTCWVLRHRWPSLPSARSSGHAQSLTRPPLPGRSGSDWNCVPGCEKERIHSLYINMCLQTSSWTRYDDTAIRVHLYKIAINARNVRHFYSQEELSATGTPVSSCVNHYKLMY